MQLRAASELEVPGRAVPASGDRNQRLPGQGLAHRVEQRAEHRAGLESCRVERQRRQDVHREEAAVAKLSQHITEQRGGLAHQGLVRPIVFGDVVAGRRSPVRTLDQEAEEGLLFRREEHGQRGVVTRDDPARLHAESDLDPLRRMAEDLTVPDQPLLAPAAPAPALGHRDATKRAGLAFRPLLRDQALRDRALRDRALRDRALQDRALQDRALRDRALQDRPGDPDAPDAQPPDVRQEQQDPRLDRVQGRGYLPHGDRGGHAVVVEGEDEQGPVCGLTQRVDGKRPDVHLDPEVLARTVDARGLRVRVHRLEADAELPDLGEVSGFAALADPADAADVRFGEGPAVVPHFQAIFKQLEGQVGRASVLGVLDQLEDEVGALAVQLPEQIQHSGVPAVPGDVLVADLLVVGWHRSPP